MAAMARPPQDWKGSEPDRWWPPGEFTVLTAKPLGFKDDVNVLNQRHPNFWHSKPDTLLWHSRTIWGCTVYCILGLHQLPGVFENPIALVRWLSQQTQPPFGDVSPKNRGIPKSSIWMGCSFTNHPAIGVPPWPWQPPSSSVISGEDPVKALSHSSSRIKGIFCKCIRIWHIWG